MNTTVNLELKDLHSVKVLICYLLKQLNSPITHDQLYEIAVGSEIINYFYFSEAMNDLYKVGAIVKEFRDGTEVLVLTSKGSSSVEEFKKYVPKSFRDKLLSSALKFFAKLKCENEVSCEIEEIEGGYYINCCIHDVKEDILQMKLYAPDMEQAKLIKDKIMLNPSDFYGKILNFALDNVEFEPKID